MFEVRAQLRDALTSSVQRCELSPSNGYGFSMPKNTPYGKMSSSYLYQAASNETVSLKSYIDIADVTFHSIQLVARRIL